MTNLLSKFYEDLDFDKVRVSRPSKLVFLCGGVIEKNKSEKSFSSLRDYLHRGRHFDQRVKGATILAENAVQLYRDTHYGDLITFEEDIAKIAALVLVIAESPGAFAELGAFATNDTIGKRLRIIIQEKYADAESFIRFGPVERIRKINRELVGVYPWRINKSGKIVVCSAQPHAGAIYDFINDHLNKIPAVELFRSFDDSFIFYILYWLIYLSVATSQSTLAEHVNIIGIQIDFRDLQNKIYCMELAGWIKRISYSGKDYFYSTTPADPFQYAYKPGVKDKISSRRKFEITQYMRKVEKLPIHVKTVAGKVRGA